MLNELSRAIHKTAVNKGWWDEKRGFPEIIALIHSELSEALEEYRNGKSLNEFHFEGEKTEEYPNGDKPAGIPIELADCIIRILDFCGKEKIDIDAAVLTKVHYNQIRSYRHGNKKA